jgi:general secretion pathway protein I
MKRRHQTGFTLIEVVIAFAIFALCAGALYEVFASSARRTAQSRDREIAWLTAQSVLSELRARPAPWKPRQTGQSAAGVSWRVDVAPVENEGIQPHEWQAVRVTVRARAQRVKGSDVMLESIELVRSSP